jgi:hypothetical protein
MCYFGVQVVEEDAILSTCIIEEKIPQPNEILSSGGLPTASLAVTLRTILP